MNLLARKIGIWYITKEWRDKIYNDIISRLPKDSIRRNVFSESDNVRITLKDNSTIDFIPAMTNMRGQRYTESYIQEGITKYVYESKIQRCTSVHPANSYVISDYYSFFKPTRIRDYFREQERREAADKNEY